MNINEQNGNGTILMVFMFRGKYLTNKIGHEIINFFKADDGEHYIYVNPWGHVNNKDYGKIETILLVRHTNNYQVEIIAKAWGLSEVFPKVTDCHLNRNDINEEKLLEFKCAQNEACKGIKYGGKTIADIFEFNEINDRQEILVSFKAGKFRRPSKTIVIPYNDKEIDMGNMPRQTLKAYFKDGDKGYDYLRKIIDKDDNWESQDNSQKIKTDEKINDNFNFLNVIGKADDELAFSNWFYYYLKNYSILNSFAKEVLKIDDVFSTKTEILREEKHIDLLIKDAESKHLIVIENKIKSGINGRQKNTQADDSNGKKEQDNVIEEDVNQLNKYKGIAEKIAEENEIPKEKINYYIFLPNYSSIKKNDCCEYSRINYEEIYNFFVKILNKNQTEYNFEKSFDMFVMEQFVKALKRHKSSYPDSLFEDNYRQFLERITALSESK